MAAGCQADGRMAPASSSALAPQGARRRTEMPAALPNEVRRIGKPTRKPISAMLSRSKRASPSMRRATCMRKPLRAAAKVIAPSLRLRYRLRSDMPSSPAASSRPAPRRPGACVSSGRPARQVVVVVAAAVCNRPIRAVHVLRGAADPVHANGAERRGLQRGAEAAGKGTGHVHLEEAFAHRADPVVEPLRRRHGIGGPGMDCGGGVSVHRANIPKPRALAKRVLPASEGSPAAPPAQCRSHPSHRKEGP
ncbi:hypothetical protein QFZ42_003231 [Variovorax paradoxus]|nr:hypothetical protein [Variovorax paradoxus]